MTRRYHRRPFDVVRRERDVEIASFIVAYRDHIRRGEPRLAPSLDEELTELARLTYDGRAPAARSRWNNPERDLFEWQGGYAEPAPGRTDTSRAAAASIALTVGQMQQHVLTAILAAGPRGLTSYEAADATGIPYATVQPRTSELKKAGKIRDSGMRRENASGRKAIVWIITEGKGKENGNDQPKRDG